MSLKPYRLSTLGDKYELTNEELGKMTEQIKKETPKEPRKVVAKGKKK